MHEVYLLQCKNPYSSGDCGLDRWWPGRHPRPGSGAGRGTEGLVLARAPGDAHCRSWGARFPFPSPGNANCPRCPKAQPPPRTPARSWRARVSAVTSPHPAPKCEPAAAGPARGKAAPGAGTGVVPSPAAPGSVGERSPLGRLRPSLALSGREGGERRDRGSLQAAPRSAARGPCCWGEKRARPRPERVGGSALCW